MKTLLLMPFAAIILFVLLPIILLLLLIGSALYWANAGNDEIRKLTI